MIAMTISPRRVRRRMRRLARNRSGVAMLEFAFALPLVLGAGMYGAETANLALVNLRISQVALNLADDASRVGITPLATEQLREVDMNDVLQAARYQGTALQLTTNGRIIVSSLENVQQSYDNAPVQRIHWQRCLGLKGSLAADAAYNSSYGTTAPTAGTDNTQANAGTPQPNGMGDTGALVNAPPGSGVVFVEINYNYKPLISNYLVGTTSRIHYIASFIVRDNRDFSQIYNPTTTPATLASTCDKYGA